MRGLRPIAEIQYLDYLLYALQVMSDDLATVQYRTKGGQKAPLIISTRGHRLEGIWHSGSPMGMIVNAVRGIYVCVPRNMTKAAGFYNTLMEADEPALVIEPLNGYRAKGGLPSSISSRRSRCSGSTAVPAIFALAGRITGTITRGISSGRALGSSLLPSLPVRTRLVTTAGAIITIRMYSSTVARI